MLRLGPGGLELIEIAPGVDLQRDVLAKMHFRPHIAADRRESVAGFLGQRLCKLGAGHDVIIDFDGFELGRPGAGRFLQLLREGERSQPGCWAWHCTDALLRRTLIRASLDAELRQPIYAGPRQAVDALGGTRARAARARRHARGDNRRLAQVGGPQLRRFLLTAGVNRQTQPPEQP